MVLIEIIINIIKTKEQIVANKTISKIISVNIVANINKITSKNFLLHYQSIVSRNTLPSFASSQDKLVDILAKKVFDKIAYLESRIPADTIEKIAEYEYIFRTIKNEIQRQLLVLDLTGTSSKLRIDINEFFTSHKSSDTFDLGAMIGMPISVVLTQDELIGVGYVYMSDLKHQGSYPLKESVLLPKVRDSADLLTKAIKAFHSDGKAKIIPIVDFIPKSPLGLGSQFLQPRAGDTALDTYMQLPKGSGIFEVDVNTDDGRRTLEYMSYLLNHHTKVSYSTISFLVKSADGDVGDGLGDFLITRNGIFRVGNIYSPQLTAESKTKFEVNNGVDLIQVEFNDYYVSTVHPTILGEEIEMSTEDFIDLMNEEWDLIWGEGTLIIYSSDLDKYIRPNYVDLLDNPYLVNRYREKGWID